MSRVPAEILHSLPLVVPHHTDEAPAASPHISTIDDDPWGPTDPARVHNFGAGPGALPIRVLTDMQAELISYGLAPLPPVPPSSTSVAAVAPTAAAAAAASPPAEPDTCSHGLGLSVLEMSHRSRPFMGAVADAEADLRALLDIPSDYAVLFLPGGASTQFAAVPLNLLHLLSTPTKAATSATAAAADKQCTRPRAQFFVTGAWSAKAAEEAAMYLDVDIAYDGDAQGAGYRSLPPPTAGTGAAAAATMTAAAAAPSGPEADDAEQAGKQAGMQAAQQVTAPLFTYICTNETVHGVEFPLPPHPSQASSDAAAAAAAATSLPAVGSTAWWHSLSRTGGVLVADMSSHLCSRPFDVRPFGVIIAGAQKNLGPAGVTVVIVRKSLLLPPPTPEQRACCGANGWAPLPTPSMLRWDLASQHGSLYNTPPAFPLYATGRVLRWLRTAFAPPPSQQGDRGQQSDRGKGWVRPLDGVAAANDAKAAYLYSALDSSNGFYTPHVPRGHGRSAMNTVFRVRSGDAALEKKLLAEAESRGLHGLAGHRSVGGLRASLYNAVAPASVSALVEFLDDFRARHE